jgi:hypothetical protein
MIRLILISLLLVGCVAVEIPEAKRQTFLYSNGANDLDIVKNSCNLYLDFINRTDETIILSGTIKFMRGDKVLDEKTPLWYPKEVQPNSYAKAVVTSKIGRSVLDPFCQNETYINNIIATNK